jgi:hypothetical protein
MIRLLELLVLLFPKPFRDEYGEEVTLQLRRDFARARAAGFLATVWFAVGTAADLVLSAVAERLHPLSRESPARLHRIRAGGPLDGWATDLAHAASALRRTPAFTVTTVGTLALAVGVTAAMYGVVEGVMLDPLPYPDAARLVYVAASAPGSDRPGEFGVSSEFYVEYRTSADLLEDVAAYSPVTRTLRVGERVERVPMATATPSLFTTLGVAPSMGRLPTVDDGPDVAVTSHEAWVTWFGADPAAVGQTHDISDRLRTIVGVMGEDFAFPTRETLAWIPNIIRAEDVFPGRFGLPLVARMAPGVTRDEVVDQLGVLARRLPDRFGGSPSYAQLIARHVPVVRPLHQEITGWHWEPDDSGSSG